MYAQQQLHLSFYVLVHYFYVCDIPLWKKQYLLFAIRLIEHWWIIVKYNTLHSEKYWTSRKGVIMGVQDRCDVKLRLSSAIIVASSKNWLITIPLKFTLTFIYSEKQEVNSNLSNYKYLRTCCCSRFRQVGGCKVSLKALSYYSEDHGWSKSVTACHLIFFLLE